MHADPMGVAVRPPGAAFIGEIPDELLLFRVHRDGRLPLPLRPPHRVGEVAKLCVPIRMLIAFARFGRALQAVAELMEEAATTVWLTWWPPPRRAVAKARTLRLVQRNGESGSPGAVGSTSASRSARKGGSCVVARFRPPPGRRIRSGAGAAPSSSRTPR